MSYFAHEDEDRRQREATRQAYRPQGYLAVRCSNCTRSRVELLANGKRICEKCHWDQDKHEYDYVHLDLFS